jgi:hypothetical protein
MTERDAFEFRFGAAVRGYVGHVSSNLDPAELAHRIAVAEPRRHGLATMLTGRTVSVPRPVWVLLLAAALLAMLVGGTLLVGSQREPRLPADAGILAMTRARPLPAQAACPPGRSPDTPGSVDQERPPWYFSPQWLDQAGAMAFDRHAGLIILLAPDARYEYERSTWTYDVCTNTWRPMIPSLEPPDAGGGLVYDADSDRTLAFSSAGRIWSYELAADHWTERGLFPEIGRGTHFGTGAVYHGASGLVIVYHGEGMWAYDVDTDILTTVPQLPDPSLPAGSGLPAGKIAFGYDPDRDLIVVVTSPDGEAPGETWTFDPGTTTWRLEGSRLTSTNSSLVYGRNPGGWFPPTEWGGRAVFDEASSMTVFINDASTWVEGYDAGERAWRTLYLVNEGNWADVNWCDSIPPVYDPLNARIICRGGRGESSGGVLAFSTATGQWRWLLSAQPEPISSP